MAGNEELPKLHCVKCGHDWVPRVPNPELCPRCKSRDWKGEVKDEKISRVEAARPQA